MAQYTMLSVGDIENIFLEYDIKNISSFEILSGGSENTNFLVIASKKKYVLTICENKSEDDLRKLALLLDHLKINNFRTSRIVCTSRNNLTSNWKNKPVMVKEFIEGKIIENMSAHQLKMTGKEMGLLHKIKPPHYMPEIMSFGKEQFSFLTHHPDDMVFYTWLNEILRDAETFISIELPKSIIHGDVFCDNVIVDSDDNAVVIMDFEEAAYYYRVFDLGMAITGLCAEGKTINLDKTKYLIEGYEQEIRLLPLEYKALQAFTVYATGAMAFWRYKNFRYLHPDPQKSDHYLGLKDLADYIRKIPASDFSQCFNISSNLK
jgi:homoserine kinase type II